MTAPIAPGLIYENLDGYGYFRASLNSDLSVTMVDGQTTRTVTLPVLELLGTLKAWAKRCADALAHPEQFPNLMIGPVGERLAQRHGRAIPAPTIGKARACTLHRDFARLGVPSGTHYALCSRALNTTVTSLAALTDEEVLLVWDFARRERQAYVA
ncbi:hypothetical protein [Deinococcus xianganensis]|uniref:Uncharacterized protein n=1 Tax=Deinococcus xianganensis TaxID=1507289 RepID=A0A6I4YWC4_9DEIO|nr:hypothetical protein [Deinococcus xianganensis]MXV21945.1 hypothetical protein [Deinococcus xianganensis]